MNDYFQCYSHTTKQEILDFISNNIGKKFLVHWEGNMYNTWGDDDFTEYDSGDDLKLIELKQIINDYEIHDIKII